MPLTRLLQGTAVDAGAAAIITAVYNDILRDLHMPSTDPVADIIARNLIRFAQAGERDPERLRDLATEFLRD